MSYSIIIGTADRTTLLIAGTLSYTLQTNHDDTATCALKTTAAGFMPAVGQSFYVYESVDAENKFGGVIDNVTVTKVEAGVSTSKVLQVDVSVSPFKAIASRRTVSYSETAVTAKTIVQKVISALSTEGITEGTVNTGASDVGEYDAPLNTLSQIMDDMCTASGFQWWIDPDKLLHFYNFDLIISASHTVTETGNYTVNSYSYDIDQYANKIFIQGHPDVGSVVIRQDTAEQTARAAIEGGSGIYGAVIVDENIVTTADATTAGDAALKWAGIIPQKLVFTAYDNLSSWYPGYRVTANLPSIGLTANTTFNIDSVTTADQGTYFTDTVNCSVRKSNDFSTAQAQTGIEFLGKMVNNASSNVSVDESTGMITPISKGVVQVWVATALSTLAKNKDVFVDTDDYSRYDMTAYATTGTLTSANGEYIELTGTAACTLTITSPGTAAGTCAKYIKNSSSQSWTIGATIDGTANYTLAANLGVALYWNNTDWRSFAGGGGASGGQSASFTSIIVSGQSTILATTAAETLEFVAGTNVTITTNTSNKTVTFASSGGGQTAVFTSILVSGQSTILATTSAGTLEFIQGSGIIITTNTSNKTVTFVASETYADGKVADAINDGTTTIAPSQNAVFDALALKAPLSSPAFTGTPAAPTAGAGDSTTQLATTAFVQQAVRSVPSKEASEYATTAALPAVVYNNGTAGVGATLTGVAMGAIGIDSQSPIVGNRILVKNQVSTFQNGIYTVTATGSGIAVFVLTRALDFNQTGDIVTGAVTYVVGGTTLAATTWDVNSADNPAIGTDAITFIQSAGPGSIIAGTGISISGVTVGVDSTIATLTGAQTFTNKTLTSPKINEAVALTTTATELNILHGATLTTTELNYVDGVTSAIQTQLDGKAIATANITDHSVVRGAGGAKGVQGSGVLVDDSNNLTGIAGATLSGLLTLSAGQIKFPVAQNASADANVLDDYEEGTFTPDLRFGGAKVGITYNTQTGKYTKVGNIVTIALYINISSKGSSAGDAVIFGLPFISSVFTALSTSYVDGMTFTGMVQVFTDNGGYTMSLLEIPSTAITNADFSNNAHIMVAGSYLTA